MQELSLTHQIRLQTKMDSLSMSPLIPPECFITIEGISSIKNLVIGDIIVFFDQNDEIVCHRIIEIDGETVITKGDNNYVIDEGKTKERIVGRVVLVETEETILDLSMEQSLKVNQQIASYSSRCNFLKNYWDTEFNFLENRLKIMDLYRLYPIKLIL